MSLVIKASTSSTLPSNVSDHAAAVQVILREIAANETRFYEVFDKVFGENFDLAKVEAIRQAWLVGDFSDVAPIEVLSADVLNGANGGFSAQTNRIYLSAEFLAQASQERIIAVLLEEIGHWVDSELNTVDTVGDEGEYFAGLVLGREFSEGGLARLQAEDDNATILVEGQEIAVEQSSNLVRADGEFQVNTYTTNDQRSSSVAGLNDGGFVVVWSSDGQDGSGYGVYGQRFDINGNPIGSEFQANTYTTNWQDGASVIGLNNGGFLVIWQSAQDENVDYPFLSTGIYGQRFDANGVPVGAEFQINTHAGSSKGSPSITNLNSGGFVVTWTSSDQDGGSVGTYGGASGIYGQRFDANGVPVGAEFQINTYIDDSQWQSSVTGLNDGGFVVVWQSDFQDGDQGGIYGQRFDANGVSVGAEFQINTYALSYQEQPSVIGLNNGGFVVVWQSDFQDGSYRGIYGQRFDANGVPVGAEFQVNTYSLNNQILSSVTTLNSGDFVVTWSSDGQDGSGYGIYAQRFNTNHFPTNISLDNAHVLENSFISTVVGTFSTTDADIKDTHTYRLTDGYGDNSLFTIDGEQLKTNAVFDYETQNNFEIEIKTDDGKGGTFTKNFTINIEDINESPISTLEYWNGVGGTSPLGDSSSWENKGFGQSFVAGNQYSQIELKAASFTLNASPDDLDIKPILVKLDTNEIIEVGDATTILRTDSGGSSAYQSIFFRNQTPMTVGDNYAIFLSAVGLADSQPSYGYLGTVRGRYYDDGSFLTATMGNGLIGDTISQININPDNEAAFRIKFASTPILNEDPTDINISSNTVDENAPVGSSVGILSTTDPDPEDTHTYVLTNGYDDNSLFTIAGNELKTNAVFDYETQSSYQIEVETDDGNGGTYTKIFEINVGDVNEDPTDIDISSNTVDENSAIDTVVGNLSTIDPDIGDSHTYSLTNGYGDNSLFTIDGEQLKTNAVFDYETQNSFEIQIQTDDGNGGTFTKVLTINVSDVNEDPDLSFVQGQTYALPSIRDYDGNLHGLDNAASDVVNGYKYQGQFDVQGNGRREGIFTNRVSGRWATVEADPLTGEIDYSRNGAGGTTRVVGIYIDPTLADEPEKIGGPFDSQRRFQNDLEIDNLIMRDANDYDGDGFQELYWKVADGTAYLRSLMHADGNIQYANYQSEQQMMDYLTSTGNADAIQSII
ncbi:cadherin repeat domain-containing protein (plasmid) [Picosynechococcus sp. PCC 11901]|uniref:cadherin repeat domain-containing protein n=1 Tax=Picosynechococcus sp. PCC 11901 TaxID=2579791 RepID=UPI0010FC179E|nr:cadherin repeat domain-containing protein [Picosynechococcus sp. PCC 11901]QCS48015.1 cadherin repeat domain-containing protein [Picosynechococcus sp. PCC 11901]